MGLEISLPPTLSHWFGQQQVTQSRHARCKSVVTTFLSLGAR
jgi:hypothetical protein